MQQRLVIRYSISFKQEVIKQLESGRFGSISEAQDHFGIKGNGTIRKWLKRYGRDHLCPKVIRVEKPDEQNQIRELKKQVRQLKEALGQTHAEKIIGDAFLEIACEDMGVEVEAFKKKVDTERSIKDDESQTSV